MKEEKYYRNNWMSFYPQFHMINLSVDKAGYFDERPQLNFTLTTLIGLIGVVTSLIIDPNYWTLFWTVLFFVGWGQCYIHLPIKTGIDECERPQYGFYIYSHTPWKPQSFVWCWNMKTYHYDLPWEWSWIRTSALRKDGEWEHEIGKHDKEFYDEERWGGILFKERYPYTYVLRSGEKQTAIATIQVREREWRWKWLRWSKYPRLVRREIDVNFDREMGEQAGSWKGGTIGLGYEIKKGETPREALRRMEKEYTFR